VELELFGRKMKFKRAYKSILITDFDELCKRPLSSNDFIELGKKFEVIIVEDVPYIGKDETDLAIRFINFIDNVYFHKVLLFISLADSPEKIYPVGKRAKEFKRTISRLHEINSESYLKNSKHQ
jgi:cell division protein ZapE